MTTPSLGRLEPVDVREIWESESGGFTPWLARDENLALLGEAIGMELELEEQEKSVGPFRADLLCRDTASERYVLVENQLERTDHRHLGQLLTYAAGLDAAAIVWIARQFSDEHRAALDWLNEITGEGFHFFALEIELWRIGRSETAPKFNIVSKPNDWTKRAARSAEPHGGDRLDYWLEFRELVLREAPELRPRRAGGRAAMRFATARRRIDYRAQAARTLGGHISVGLAVRGGRASDLFEVLKSRRGAIESELPFPVEWIEHPTVNKYHIRTRKAADPDDRSDWPAQHAWLLEHLRLFKQTLDPHIASLPEGESGSEAADGGD